MHKLSRDEHIAVKVMSESRMVRKWVLGELQAFGIDPGSPEGKKFIEEKKVEIAKRIVAK